MALALLSPIFFGGRRPSHFFRAIGASRPLEWLRMSKPEKQETHTLSVCVGVLFRPHASSESRKGHEDDGPPALRFECQCQPRLSHSIRLLCSSIATVESQQLLPLPPICSLLHTGVYADTGVRPRHPDVPCCLKAWANGLCGGLGRWGL